MSRRSTAWTTIRGSKGRAGSSRSSRRPRKGDVTILHFALPSPLTAGLARQAGRKAIVYHNITPERFFAPYNAEMARICRLGREELASLAPSVDLALADSEYNRRELADLGFRKTDVLPLFIDFRKYGTGR